MPDTSHESGQSLATHPSTVNNLNLDTLISKLRQSALDDRLLRVLQDFFAEKGISKIPGDRQYFIDFASDLHHITNQYTDTDLQFMLLQRLVMYGLNSPRLIAYYYDAFTQLEKKLKPADRRSFIARLLQTTEVVELYRWYAEYPTLKESTRLQLYAWIRNVEREQFGFFNVPDNDLGPLHKLGVKPAVFMHIYRVMEETGFLTPLAKRDPLYRFMSQTLLSDDDRKLEPKTFKNRFVYENAEDIQEAIDRLDRMKKELRYAQKIVSK